MAIDTITPVADSSLEHGDSVSFKVDDTYTTLTIECETSGGYEYAYDSALSGTQTGYIVTIVASGGRHTFTVTRTAGWDLSPFNFRVVENETGSSATTTTSYVLGAENSFPQGEAPYNGSGAPGSGEWGSITGTLSDQTDLQAALDAKKPLELSGAGEPGASTGNGYALGTIYVDTTGDTGYTLVDATTDANVWSAGGGSGGGGLGTWAYAALGSVSTKFSASADDLSTVTYFLISDDNTELSEMSLALAALPAGANLFLWDTDDETRCAQYTIGAVTDQAGYTTVPVTFVAETAGTGSAVTDEEWRFYVQPIADTDTSDHGALTGLTDDDHVRYVDVAGTREQDAVFFDYRADHVNTPAAGKAEIWVAPKAVLDSPMFTDSTGTDWTIARGSAMNDSEIPFWVAGVNGDYLFTSSGFTYASGKLTLGGGTADLTLVERATGPTFAVGEGMIWVKTAAPNQLWFTDDAGGESQVGNVVGPASATNRGVALYDGTTGKLLKDSAGLSYGGIQANTLALTGGTGCAVALVETGTAPTNTASYGKYWVKNDAPTTPWFTDDVAGDYQLVTTAAAGTTDCIPFWSATGHLEHDNGFRFASSPDNMLYINGAGGSLRLAEAASLAASSFAGYGHFWVKAGTSVSEPWFTDDAGAASDIGGDVVGPASATDNSITTWDGTTGKLVASESDLLYNNGNFQMNHADPAIKMGIHATSPSSASGAGYWFVGGSGTAATAQFKDGAGNIFKLNTPLSIALASNELVSLDATEVVIGGAYLDGSTGGTYSWEILGTYNDNGGTGNQDMEVRLYDRGPDGTPVAGVLRSVIEITSLDTLDRVSQALTVASSPGVDADEIDSDEPRLMEVRVYMDCGGGNLDSGHVLSCRFTES